MSLTLEENLTNEESFILQLIKARGKPLGEHEVHMIISILETSSMLEQSHIGKRLYKFTPQYWEELDERYVTKMGSLPFSNKLHEQVNSLIRKGYVERSSNNPIIIYESKQPLLF